MSKPTKQDIARLNEAIELARHCPPSATFRVGALITDDEHHILATGFSGEHASHDHAEEVALDKLRKAGEVARASTIYSSLQPCSTRASKPVSCTQHIIEAGIRRVVFAWREPKIFVDNVSTELLREAGHEVVEVPELAPLARRENKHLSDVDSIQLAGVIITDPAGRILLLHRATPKRTQWEIPGGKIEPGETPAYAAAREAREELGAAVTIIRELGTETFTEDGDEFTYTWFFATVDPGSTPHIGEPEDYDDLKYWPLSQLANTDIALSANTRNFIHKLRRGEIVI